MRPRQSIGGERLKQPCPDTVINIHARMLKHADTSMHLYVRIYTNMCMFIHPPSIMAEERKRMEKFTTCPRTSASSVAANFNPCSSEFVCGVTVRVW